MGSSLADRSTLATPPALGVNLIGHVSGNFGLGVAARSTAARLLAWGHPVTVVDVDPGDGRARRDLSFASLEREGPSPRSLNLFHMNPLKIVKFARQWRPRASLRLINVCVPFWEMPHLPLDWLPVLGVMDAVMAPSRFIRNAIENGLPGVPVLDYPQTVVLPQGVRPDRARWGGAAGAVTFLIAFDPFSGTVRKNPAGAVEAFQRAFRSGEHVELVVKINRSKQSAGARADPDLLKLTELARSDPRIRIVDECLSYGDVISLYASADVMVSLHRAEGFGLHLMEAMTLGKPVIATGWSGNMDFMTAENSCLVGYRLDRVIPDGRVAARESLRPGQVWAEPDLDEAAAWMRRLADSPAMRSEVGERAARSMREWTAAANAASPFLEIGRAAAARGLPARMRRHANLARLVWRSRAASLRNRWGLKLPVARESGSTRGRAGQPE